MPEYEFRCVSCARRIVVDESMREAVLRTGCPVCDTPVTREQFSLSADRPDDSR